MSRHSPFVICLPAEDRAVLEELSSSRTAAHAKVVRARIVLLASQGMQNIETGSPPMRSSLAQLFGSVADKTGIAPFMALAEQVMCTEPYASAANVYWVVDNGSSHNGQRSIDRMTAAWPNAHLIHLPVHASWLNQIEIVFSIIQRKVIRPADFADLGVLANRLLRFQERYNQTAHPFDRRFTTSDLAQMLGRLDAHGQQHEVSLAA